MTLIKETTNTQRNKWEIFKFLKFLESEKIIDKKTLKSVKNEMLSAYYLHLVNNEKSISEIEKNKKLKKINSQIIDIEKKINEVKKELRYNKVKTMSKISINNHSKKRLRNIVRNSTKMMAHTRGFLSNIIGQSINKAFDKMIKRKSKIDLEKWDLQIKYKNLKQKRNQLLEEKDKLTKTNNNLITNQKKTLKEYIDVISDWKIKKILNHLDSLDIWENDLQKEKIKTIILDSFKKAKVERQEDDIYKMAKSLKSYLNENFAKIINELDWIQEKIIELTLKKSKIKEKIKLWETEDIIWLKEEEYQHQIEIMKLKKEYNEIKYDIDEKLKAYDWSTFEEKKKEFLKNKKI